MSAKTYFPLFMDMERRPVLVVGGGEVGTGKIGQLLKFQAVVTVVSPEVTDQVRDWAWRGQITWRARTFADDDLAGHFLAIAATDDPAVNARVFQLAEGRNMLANSADDLDNCNFILGAIAQAGPLQVVVSSSGTSPTLAGRIRDEILQDLTERGLDKVALFLGRWRPLLTPGLKTFADKKRFWREVMDSPIPGWVSRGQEERADDYIEILWSRETGQTLSVEARSGI